GGGTPRCTTHPLFHLLGNPARNGIATPVAGFGVNAVNGNFFHEEVDAAMPGKDIPFVFSRAYNSLSEDKDKFDQDLPKPLGAGWTHAYNIVLRSNGTNAEVIWGDGRHDGFAKSGSAWQAGTPGNFSTLSEVSGQTYTWELTTKSQMRYRFDTTGKLLSIVSRSSNSMSFSYTGSQLSAITDTQAEP
ncbi:MAG: hypothetical protein HC887_02035, partial [Desulfobacteraceae bacterium]|nr:hypothetical protein [Desulfobacteraceae bacterium]